MEMTPEKWEKVKVLFEAALDKPTEQRIAYLAGVCAEEDVRAQVTRLLANLEDAGSFLSKPAVTGLDLAATSSAADNLLAPVHKGSMVADENSKLTGGTISHYRVLDQIGAGGMGVVYRAYDEQLDRNVALKVLPSGLLADEEARKRFRKEALALAKLNHPNIETVFEFGSQDGVDFLAMELIPGEPLNEKLKAGPLSERDLARFGMQLAEGLAAAHEQGVIHSDLKPANIFITPDNRLKILDFGLARLLKTGEDNDVTKTITSQSGSIAGTLPYMSPEQLRAEPIDARSDIYAAGTVLYEMATGKRPFAHNQPVQLIGAILHAEPALPTSLNQHLQPGMEVVILKALDKSPSERYQTAREFRTALETLTVRGFASSPVSADVRVANSTASLPGAVASPPGGPWKAYATGLAVVLVLGTLAGVLVSRYRRGPETGQRTGQEPDKAQLVLPTTKPRPSIAVLGFKNLTTPEEDWVSGELTEWLSTELAAGEHLRTIAGEDVARLKTDLSLPTMGTYSKETLAKIRRILASDYVVTGAYDATGSHPSDTVRVDVHLQDSRSGEELASFHETGTIGALSDLTKRVGSSLRGKLGVQDPNDAQAAQAKAALPSDPEASRLYTEGLEELRKFDPLNAEPPLQRAAALDPNWAAPHAALAESWQLRGYDSKAQEEAQKAVKLSSNLSDVEKSSLEGRFHELNYQWDQAIKIYQGLWVVFPDEPNYGLDLARAQSSAGKGKDALATLDSLQKMPDMSGDPRIDLARSYAAASLSDAKRQQQFAAAAAKTATALGSRYLAAQAYWQLCSALYAQGDFKSGQKACQDSNNAAPFDDDVRARSQTVWANILEAEGQIPEALSMRRQALETAEKIGSQKDIVGAKQNLADMLEAQGDSKGARNLYQEAMQTAQAIGDQNGLLQVENDFAGQLASDGDYPGADSMYQRSLATARTTGDNAGIAMALENRGLLQFERGNLTDALDDVHQALMLQNDSGLQTDRTYALNLLGSILLARGDIQAAQKNFDLALKLALDQNDASAIASSRVGLADLNIETARFSEAEHLAKPAADEFARENLVDEEANAQDVLAQALIKQGKFAEARTEFDRAASLPSHDHSIRTSLTITGALLKAQEGKQAEAINDLDALLAQTDKQGQISASLEIELARAQIEGTTNPSRAATYYQDTEKSARSKGFLLIATKAMHEREKLGK